MLSLYSSKTYGKIYYIYIPIEVYKQIHNRHTNLQNKKILQKKENWLIVNQILQKYKKSEVDKLLSNAEPILP